MASPSPPMPIHEAEDTYPCNGCAIPPFVGVGLSMLVMSYFHDEAYFTQKGNLRGGFCYGRAHFSLCTHVTHHFTTVESPSEAYTPVVSSSNILPFVHLVVIRTSDYSLVREHTRILNGNVTLPTNACANVTVRDICSRLQYIY